MQGHLQVESLAPALRSHPIDWHPQLEAALISSQAWGPPSPDSQHRGQGGEPAPASQGGGHPSPSPWLWVRPSGAQNKCSPQRSGRKGGRQVLGQTGAQGASWRRGPGTHRGKALSPPPTAHSWTAPHALQWEEKPHPPDPSPFPLPLPPGSVSQSPWPTAVASICLLPHSPPQEQPPSPGPSCSRLPGARSSGWEQRHPGDHGRNRTQGCQAETLGTGRSQGPRG